MMKLRDINPFNGEFKFYLSKLSVDLNAARDVQLIRLGSALRAVGRS